MILDVGFCMLIMSIRLGGAGSYCSKMDINS